MKILSISSNPERQEWMKNFEEQPGIEHVQCMSAEGGMKETFAAIPFDKVDMIVFDFRFPHFFGDELGYEIDLNVPDFPYILLTEEEDAVLDRTPLMHIQRIIPIMDYTHRTLSERFSLYTRYYQRLVETRDKEYHEMLEKFKEKPTSYLESEINDRVRFLNSVPGRTVRLPKLEYGTRLLDNLIEKMEDMLVEVRKK